jgi:hypothetical protein
MRTSPLNVSSRRSTLVDRVLPAGRGARPGSALKPGLCVLGATAPRSSRPFSSRSGRDTLRPV